jgi:nucleoside phosphorylase
MSIRTIVFLTALECEYEAVKAHLEKVEPKFEEKNYTIGTYCTSQGVMWQVVVRRQQSQGNYIAIQETDWAIRRFEPNYLFFVGIAGGVEEDVNLGDVVVAEKVIGYESGREQEPSPKVRPITKEPAEFLVELAKHVVDENHWLENIKNREDRSPKVYVRPIASGEKTVASKKFSRKLELGAVAFEKEGFGFLKVISSKNQYGIVIRGISDLLADKKNTDKQGWQTVAARHAAGFAFTMLEELPEFPPQDCREAKKIIEILDEPPWEVFVSYAEIDDRPLPGNDKGWVTTFMEGLNTKILSQRGKDTSFYPLGLQKETKFQKERLVKYTRSHALLNSKLVIAILSEGYFKSPYFSECNEGCKKVLVVRREATSYPPAKKCVGKDEKNLRLCGKFDENFEPFYLGSPEYESFLDKLANDIVRNLGKRA